MTGEDGEDSEHKTILDNLLKIFETEFTRFDRVAKRHKTLKARCKRNKQLIPQLEKDTKSINIVIAKQNQIFHMCLEILNRSNFLDERFHEMQYEDSDMLTRMFQKFSCYLVRTLDRNDVALILTTFEMLDKIFQYFEMTDIIKEEHLALRMERFFESKVYLYPYLLLGRLFRHNFLDREELKIIIPSIVSTTDDKRIRQNTFQLLSLMSFNQTVKESLIEIEYDLSLFMIMINLIKAKFQKGVTSFSKTPLQRALINIVLNLSSEAKEADLLIQNPMFKIILKIGFQTLDIGLLKIINNVTFFCNPNHTQKMKKPVLTLREMVKKLVIEEKGQNMIAVTEILGILSNCVLGEFWEGFLDKDFFMILKNFCLHHNDHLRLQAILLLAQLCMHKKSAGIFMKRGLIHQIVQQSVREDMKHREEQFQVLFVVYQIVLSGLDIEPLLDDLFEIVYSFLNFEFKEKHTRVVSFMNEFLTILQVNYKDNHHVNSLLDMRFSLYNFDWEKKVGLEEIDIDEGMTYEDLFAFYTNVPEFVYGYNEEEYVDGEEYADYGDYADYYDGSEDEL